MNDKKRSKIPILILAFGIVSIVTMVLVFPGASAKGITDGMKYSAEMLIPSLFPFMVLSSFLIRSGVSDVIGKAFAPVTKVLFGLPEDSGAAIVLAFVGGFPVGAKCVRLLYDEGRLDDSQAERMMLFCVCSGPGFLVTGVGGILLHNMFLGWILYISQICSGIIIGAAARLFSVWRGKTMQSVKSPIHRREKLSDAFIESCSDGANSVLLLTAMVTFFTMVLDLFSECGIFGISAKLFNFIGVGYPVSDTILTIIFEVTGACKTISSSGSPLWIMSFAVGFGGLCVHFQIFAILGGIKINRLRYFLFRIINAFLSSVIVYIVCRFYCPVGEVFAVSGGGKAEISSVSAAGSFALIVMCVVFLMSIRRKNCAF